jgi:hypothetical protein
MGAEVPEVERVLCCNVLESETACRSSVFRHPLYAFEEEIPWPPANYKNIFCWHCCHAPPDDAVPLPLPNSFDRRRGVFHVFGFFCSLNCAKAYLAEHSGFSSGEKLMLLQCMAAKHFGLSDCLVGCAPPRHRLTVFGGDLSVDQFRNEHVFFTRVLSTPLESTPELYERRDQAKTSESQLNGSCLIDNPPTCPAQASVSSSASLFSSFVSKKRTASSDAKPLREAKVPGTLSIFMKTR